MNCKYCDKHYKVERFLVKHEETCSEKPTDIIQVLDEPIISKAPVPVEVDLPKGLTLNVIETDILRMFVAGKTTKDISLDLGIPKASIVTLLSKPKVKEFVQEMIDARNTVLKMELPNMLMDIIQDKLDVIADDPEARLASSTKKDVVDIARALNDMLKTTSGGKDEEEQNEFAKIYQQFNIGVQK